MTKKDKYYGKVSLTFNEVEQHEYKKVSGINDAVKICRDLIGDKIQMKEIFVVVCFNNSNNMVASSIISEGGITGTVVDIRNLFQTALLSNATGIIVAHNHPSGKLTASTADKHLTKKINEAGEILDIKLLDSIIITKNGYDSIIY